MERRNLKGVLPMFTWKQATLCELDFQAEEEGYKWDCGPLGWSFSSVIVEVVWLPEALLWISSHFSEESSVYQENHMMCQNCLPENLPLFCAKGFPSPYMAVKILFVSKSHLEFLNELFIGHKWGSATLTSKSELNYMKQETFWKWPWWAWFVQPAGFHAVPLEMSIFGRC